MSVRTGLAVASSVEDELAENQAIEAACQPIVTGNLGCSLDDSASLSLGFCLIRGWNIDSLTDELGQNVHLAAYAR